MKKGFATMPPLVIRRLFYHLTYLQEQNNKGVGWTSSQEIAEAIGLTSSTVRQDISYLNFTGISKCGYEVKRLLATLSDTLITNKIWKLVNSWHGKSGKSIYFT